MRLDALTVLLSHHCYDQSAQTRAQDIVLSTVAVITVLQMSPVSSGALLLRPPQTHSTENLTPFEPSLLTFVAKVVQNAVELYHTESATHAVVTEPFDSVGDGPRLNCHLYRSGRVYLHYDRRAPPDDTKVDSATFINLLHRSCLSSW